MSKLISVGFKAFRLSGDIYAMELGHKNVHSLLYISVPDCPREGQASARQSWPLQSQQGLRVSAQQSFCSADPPALNLAVTVPAVT